MILKPVSLNGKKNESTNLINGTRIILIEPISTDLKK